MKKVEESVSDMVFDCDIEVDSDDEKEWDKTHKLMAIIGDEDTCVGFMLGGIGELDIYQEPNYFTVYPKTEDYKVRFAFEKFAARKDIAIILITKEAADKIHNVVKNYNRHLPALLVIPGHNGPFQVGLPPEVQEIEERRSSLSSSRRSTEHPLSSSDSFKTLAEHQKIKSSYHKDGSN